LITEGFCFIGKYIVKNKKSEQWHLVCHFL